MTLEWMEVLFSIWKENHTSKFWPDIYELHDQEDRQYFLELEESNG